MSDRLVPIALAAVAFTATLAVLWHRQPENESRPSPSHAQARKQQIATISAFQPVNTSTQQEPGATPHAFTPTRVAPTESETPAVSTQSTADEVDAELPVTMSFRRVPGHDGLEGGIANSAGQALDVTATLLAAGTGQQQQVQLTLDPGAGHRIGAADGWEMHSGDQVTVHSPPFHDRVFPVP